MIARNSEITDCPTNSAKENLEISQGIDSVHSLSTFVVGVDVTLAN